MDYTDTELLPSPQPVRFSHLSGGAEKILKVVCGDDHIMVLTSDGKVFSWGKSSQGQLGIMDESTGDTSKALKLKSKKGRNETNKVAMAAMKRSQRSEAKAAKAE